MSESLYQQPYSPPYQPVAQPPYQPPYIPGYQLQPSPEFGVDYSNPAAAAGHFFPFLFQKVKLYTLASSYAAPVLSAYQMQYPSKKLISNQPTQEFGLDYSAPQAGAGGEVN